MGSHMKTTLDLADPLFHAAKAMAAQQQTTLRALVEEGLRLVMAQRKQAAAKPYKLEDFSVGGKQISPYDIAQINDDYALERFHRANVYLKEDMEIARAKQLNETRQQNGEYKAA
jgi:HD superfamily phosphodiesterase